MKCPKCGFLLTIIWFHSVWWVCFLVRLDERFFGAVEIIIKQTWFGPYIKKLARTRRLCSYSWKNLLARQWQSVHLFGGNGDRLREARVMTWLNISLDTMTLWPQHQQTVLILDVPHLTQSKLSHHNFSLKPSIITDLLNCSYIRLHFVKD